MSILAINISLIEVSVLLIGSAILGMAIYFFLESKRTLYQTIRQNKLDASFKSGSKLSIKEEERKPILQYQIEEKRAYSQPAVVPAAKKDLTFDLRETVLNQQKILSGLLKQVEEIENEGKDELRSENRELLNDIKRLESIIDKKNEEINALKQQAAMAQKMASRIEEIYQEFDQLQEKMVQMEKQASNANNLAIELEDTKQSFEQVHKELLRKQERLDESFEENQRLQLLLNSVEDKLSDANLQRQQLQKKVQFLQDLNTEMQNMSDANQKLKTELRRIGELESMLNMIAEERDHLLKKKTGQ